MSTADVCVANKNGAGMAEEGRSHPKAHLQSGDNTECFQFKKVKQAKIHLCD